MKGKGQKKVMGGIIFITGISEFQVYQKIKNKSKVLFSTVPKLNLYRNSVKKVYFSVMV